MITQLKEKILGGGEISREEALSLSGHPDLEALCEAADELRRAFCGNWFSLCSIVNAKSGHCSENCKFCAQSAHFPVGTQEYPLMGAQELAQAARDHFQRGVGRFSLVTSGRTLSREETQAVCGSVRKIKEQCGVSVCGSHGLLDYGQLAALRQAGVTRYHCNLETSRRNFPAVCTTHTYEDKIRVLRDAKHAGLQVCSGCIIGMGETMRDRIDLALDLRELKVDSVPVNVLTPIPKTPFEAVGALEPQEILRTVAVFRFLLPKAVIRMAAGRGRFEDKGEKLFTSGANGAITGDMLTTSGISIETDLQLIRRLGYELERV